MFLFYNHQDNIPRYAAFGAFLIFAATGLAIAYSGCSILMLYVAYLSPWIPPWLWFAVGSVMVFGILITAVGTSGSIGAMAQKPTLRNVCVLLVFLILFTEMSMQVFLRTKGCVFSSALENYVKGSMTISQYQYSFNLSDTQMWDEIQFEMNCCGVNGYSDWYDTGYGNGTNVPDSCCLLVEPNCGLHVADLEDPGDQVVTEGCLPTIMKSISGHVNSMERTVWIPTAVIQVIVAFILVYAFMKESLQFMYDRQRLIDVACDPAMKIDPTITKVNLPNSKFEYAQLYSSFA